MTLTDLAKKYGTDKLEHGYMPFYEQHLPKNPLRILEIGVKEGKSMRMWREYFPDAQLHGLDLFIEYPPPEDVPGVVWHTGNQIDYLMLDMLRHQQFDVIIDDGSHNSRDQMMTFFGLMHETCNYFIEDLQCCLEPFYQQGLPFRFTAINNITNAIHDTNSPIMLVRC
ncbi:MAG: hypothetical protein H0X33_14125 [Taibaiella sp.]|nr:hypothetical protein [Taibaiella sp.]